MPIILLAFLLFPLFECIKLSGNFSIGYYFLYTEFGSPGQLQTLILDTGSSLTLTTCTSCENCGEHTYPPFDPGLSSTFSPYNSGESFSILYAEGSSYNGTFFKDFLRFEGEKVREKGVLGCVKSETGALRSQPAEGIIGLGVSPMFSPFQTESFAICIGHNGGEITFSGWNFHLHFGPRRFILSEPGLFSRQYGVRLGGVRIGERKLDISAEDEQKMPPFFDTGSTVVYFPSALYRAIMKGLSRFCSGREARCGGQKSFNSCMVSGGRAQRTFLSSFPSIDFQFSGASISWRPENYFYRNGDGKFCILWEEGEQTIFGAPIMRNFDVFFDRKNFRIGIAQAKCSGLEIEGSLLQKTYPSWVRPRPSTVLASRNSPYWVDQLGFFSER